MSDALAPVSVDAPRNEPRFGWEGYVLTWAVAALAGAVGAMAWL